MSRLAAAFADRDGPVFVGFLVAGDPDPAMSLAVAKTMIDAGAGILEVAIPFSDPMADGPIIQQAHERALAAGMTPDAAFDLVQAIRGYAPVPVVLFTYANIVFRQGWERFAARAAGAGADALLVVDLPPEESGDLAAAAARHGLDLIRLIAPTTSAARRLIRLIAPTTSAARRRRVLAGASGFVYLVAVEGVTGVRDDLPAYLADLIRTVRQETRLPLAVGFGVSRPGHVQAIAAAGADAVVVGSAITRIIGEHPDGGTKMLQAVGDYVAAMVGRP